MHRSRLAVLVFGSALAVGGFVAPALARSDDASNTPSPPSPTTPSSTAQSSSPSSSVGASEAETHTATAGGPVTLTVAGVGTVTLTVDPTTAAISDVVVTPIDGVGAGAPVATPEGVRIQVTAADGTVRVLRIRARHDDAGLEVESEIENEVENENEAEPADQADDRGADPVDRSGPDPGHGPGDHRGPDGAGTQATAPTTADAGVFTAGPGPSGDDHGGDSGFAVSSGGGSGNDRSSGGESGGDHSGRG